MDEYGRGYGYSHHDNQFSDDSDSNEDELSNHGKNVAAATTADILHNFPYLKQGGLSQRDAVSPTFQRAQHQFGPRFPVNYPDMGQLASGMPLRPPSHALSGYLQQLQMQNKMQDNVRQPQQNTHAVELPSMQHFAAAYGNMARQFPVTNAGMSIQGRMSHVESNPMATSLPTNISTHSSDTFSFPHVEHHAHSQSNTVASHSVTPNFNHTSGSFPLSTFDSSHTYRTSICVAQSPVTAANLATSPVYSPSHTRTYPFQQPEAIDTIPGRSPVIDTIPGRSPVISTSATAEPQNFSQHNQAENYQTSKMEMNVESTDVATDLSAAKQLNTTTNYIQDQSAANLSANVRSDTDPVVTNNPIEYNAIPSVPPEEFHNVLSKFAKAKALYTLHEKPDIPNQATDSVVKQEKSEDGAADTNLKVKNAIAEVINSAKQRVVKNKRKVKKKTPVHVPDDKIEPVNNGVKAPECSPLQEEAGTADNIQQSDGVRVKFVYKGKLRNFRTPVKSIQAILEEPVDSEDVFYENLECNFPLPKTSGWEQGETHRKLSGHVDGESDDGAGYASEGEISPGYRLPPTGNEMTDNWYSAAMKKYADMTDGNFRVDSSLKLNPLIKVGGRSDPDNPFAITSPSFSEQAIRGVVTTKQFATMTNVMISITSIGSRKKLIPTVVNSEAAAGGIVTVINPIEETDEKDENNVDKTSECDTDDIKTDKTSILSKLRREKPPTKAKEEEPDTDLDRLDINIRVDNDQCVSHGDQKRWACKLCFKSYTTKHNLVSHILDHTGIKPHLCLVCGKYFRQLSHLNTHMLTHDNVKPHTCDVCDKDFTQISHLKRHMTVHLDSKPYRCDICMRGFTYPSELRAHREKHVPGKDKCTECGLECTGTRDLAQHMQTHDSRNNLTCNFCSRVFRFPAQLRDHMMSHSGARPYMCTECGMDFMKEHHLKAHQFTHSGQKPYGCPFCSRAFNQKANMARHMLIHNAERAFVCPVCDKTFTQPQTLKAHMVVHEETKPYSCKYCGKQFGRLHNLQGHMHMHNNSKPYVCSICQSSFTLKGNLNRHKKLKHGLSESTENMEEDAVNFLTSLSDRTRDHSVSSEDLETSKDESVSPGKRSPKKGRKSTPRKHISSKKDDEDSKFTESGTELDNDSDDMELEDDMVMISYSDEERENEVRLQLKLLSSENSPTESTCTSKRKRKRDVSYKVDNSNEENGLDSGDESVGTGVAGVDSANGETETVTNKGKAMPADVGGADEEINTDTVNTKSKGTPAVGKRSRKRKKKSVLEDDFDDGFEKETYTPQSTKSRKKKGDFNDLEETHTPLPTKSRKKKVDKDDFDETYSPQPTKSRKKKADKLDSLIASKFKNIE